MRSEIYNMISNLVTAIFLLILALFSSLAILPEYVTISPHLIAERNTVYSQAVLSMQNVLDRVPEEITEYINENGIEFQALTKHTFLESGNDISDKWIAYTRGSQTAYFNTSFHDPLMVGEAMIHELGHIIDCGNGSTTFQYSETDEFEKLFGQYQKQLQKFRGVPIPNVHEAFAEGFMHYVLSPRMLKRNCPDLYYYYTNIFPIQNKDSTDYTTLMYAKFLFVFTVAISAVLLIYILFFKGKRTDHASY